MTTSTQIPTHPFVTVVIPAHNEEKLIGECIRSIFETQWPRDQLEILVVDHQSTDATASVAASSGARVLSGRQDMKIGAVRNVGLNAAKGEFVAFVDADCTVPKTWIRSAIDILRSGTQIGAVGGGPALSPKVATWVEHCLGPSRSGPRFVRHTNTLVTYSFIAPTNLLRDLGGFDETLISGEDDDMSNRIRRTERTLIASSDCRVIHYGYAKTLLGVLRKEMWHGSNHIEVRSGFDLTLALTLVFLTASLAEIASLAALVLYPTTPHQISLAASLLLQFAPVGMFTFKKLVRSGWQWRTALPLIAVGYAYFVGHSLGVVGNIFRRIGALLT